MNEITEATRNEIERELLKKGASRDVIEREGWQPLDQLSERDAVMVLDWLRDASYADLREQPTPEPSPVRAAPATSEGRNGDRVVRERKWGVWTVTCFYDAETMNVRLYARRFNGGPENEYEQTVTNVPTLASAEASADGWLDGIVRTLGG